MKFSFLKYCTKGKDTVICLFFFFFAVNCITYVNKWNHIW